MVLDTHVWLWAAEGEVRRLGARTRRALERARSRGELHISTVSIFEIAALQLAGRLDLSTSAEHWIRESIEVSGLKVLDITAAIAIDAGSIPATVLADPSDRFLVAAARRHMVPLVTRDTRILDYARTVHSVSVVNAAQ